MFQFLVSVFLYDEGYEDNRIQEISQRVNLGMAETEISPSSCWR